MTESRNDLARFLRQRLELGQDPVILNRLTREEALKIVGREPPSRRPGSEGSPAPDTRPLGVGSRPAVAPTDRGGSAVEQPLPAEYEALREAALVCTKCRLSETRTQVVFSDGNPNGRLVVVGEAPGANEDRTGLPFVGQAGKLLDLLLASVGLSRRDSVYICNVLKCRPPGNRNPNPDEIELCSPYLRRQISLVSPSAILAVGTFSAQLLTGRNQPLGKLRGSVYSYEGVPLVVSYHPAALLRNPGWTRATWDDLQLLRQVLDGS